MLIEIILFILIILILFNLNKKPKGMPPGEWGLPVVGYLPFMQWKVTKTLKKLEAKHGKIFTLKLGSIVFVVLCDYNLMKTALNRPEISGRPIMNTFDYVRKYKKRGMIYSDNQIWATNRKFALKTFKDFGFGTTKLEDIIRTEAKEVVRDLKKNVGTSYKVEWNLNVAILNVVWSLVASRRYETEDEEIKQFTFMVNSNIRDINGPLVLLDVFPILKTILPTFIKNSWMKQNDIRIRRDEIYRFFMEIIDEHKKSLDLNNARDYIDAYLTEKELQKDNKDYSHFGDADLLVEIMDIFLAGSDTTATSLRWFFLYMAKYKDIQRRVQEELDRVLLREKIPTMQDKQNLPLLEALTYEMMRVISLSPIAVPHRVFEDTKLEGYLIPKDTLVIPYTEFIHFDSTYWKNPTELSLEHFLDDEGKFLPPTKGFVPFSIGRRTCPGEYLAKAELFIFMGAILQNFNISEPEGQSASLEPTEAIFQFNHPKPFQILLHNRD